MFENEIEKQSKVSDFGFGFSLECADARVLHVSGHKKILVFTASEILLLLKKQCISILGTSLRIKEMRKGELLVIGNIECIRFGEK